MKNQGFTLVEIIIVVVTRGILASIAIPKVLAPNETITSSEGRQTLTAILGSQKRYTLDNGGAYATVADVTVAGNPLDITIPASQYFNAPTAFNPAGGAGVVASVGRRGGLYTLSISDTGVITCTDGTVTCASINCNKGGGGNQCN